MANSQTHASVLVCCGAFRTAARGCAIKCWLHDVTAWYCSGAQMLCKSKLSALPRCMAAPLAASPRKTCQQAHKLSPSHCPGALSHKCPKLVVNPCNPARHRPMLPCLLETKECAGPVGCQQLLREHGTAVLRSGQERKGRNSRMRGGTVLGRPPWSSSFDFNGVIQVVNGVPAQARCWARAEQQHITMGWM